MVHFGFGLRVADWDIQAEILEFLLFLLFILIKKTGFYFSGNVDLEEGDDSYTLSESQQKIITAIKEFEAN